MQREKLQTGVNQANKRVGLCEQRIARQREFVLGLERLGNNSIAARALLDELEIRRIVLITQRDALSRELQKLR